MIFGIFLKIICWPKNFKEEEVETKKIKSKKIIVLF
jgi:hypothetical protein